MIFWRRRTPQPLPQPYVSNLNEVIEQAQEAIDSEFFSPKLIIKLLIPEVHIG